MTKGLRQFLDADQQRAWLDGEVTLKDGERAESDDLEQRFKYTAPPRKTPPPPAG